MDQRVKAAIVLGTISFIIYVIYLMTSGGENNYLNPSGNRNPANQKLMVVDQDTGEISFIQKSLQGVNAQIVSDDSVISDAIAKLRTDLINWNQDRRNEITALQNNYATKAYVDGELAKKQVKGNYQAAGNYISSGNYIALARNGDNGCGGKGCRAVTGFKDHKNSHGSERSGWHTTESSFNHGKDSTMRIWKN